MSYYGNMDHLGESVEIVTEFERSEPCYDFDTVLVLHGPLGYYIGQDSGCSCPLPFEDFHSLDDFSGPFDFHEVVQKMTEAAEDSYNSEYANRELVDSIETLMKFERRV